MIGFTEPLLDWYDVHGRHDLPWKQPASPYRVWLSEVMLQQTQVVTVIPYFERFVAAFPSIEVLAEASIDDVLAHWAGLGYYARGRNLHAAAKQMQTQFGGEFPRDFDDALSLKGVGRSTAGAVLAQAYNLCFPILDGNVKRVLSRQLALKVWPGEALVQTQLWDEALARTSTLRPADYTQAIMDLGATVCTRRHPACLLCPVTETCMAYQRQRVDEFPVSKPKKAKPHRQKWWVVRLLDQSVQLTRRPDKGLWGGLYAFDEFDTAEGAYGAVGQGFRELAPIRHEFTHYSATFVPLLAKPGDHVAECAPNQIWLTADAVESTAMPTPVKQLANTLIQQGQNNANGELH